MDDVQCFHAKWRGFKAGMTKLLAKVEDIGSELKDINSESITEKNYQISKADGCHCHYVTQDETGSNYWTR